MCIFLYKYFPRNSSLHCAFPKSEARQRAGRVFCVFIGVVMRKKIILASAVCTLILGITAANAARLSFPTAVHSMNRQSPQKVLPAGDYDTIGGALT